LSFENLHGDRYRAMVRSIAHRSMLFDFVYKALSSRGSLLKLNGDIKNISGATLSSKHVTDGVKRVLRMYQSSLKGR
jgi:Na+-translocating ferredoxin:NAD+ oxidoreductase RnfG subunit